MGTRLQRAAAAQCRLHVTRLFSMSVSNHFSMAEAIGPSYVSMVITLATRLSRTACFLDEEYDLKLDSN